MSTFTVPWAPPMSSRDETSAIAVVIPRYGRPSLVHRCLRALAAVDPPSGGFEVIVVDDGSPEPLAGVVAAFESILDIRVIRQRNAGPASARNNGVRATRAPWVAFLDDDCVPEREWLTGLEETIRNAGTCAAGGRMVSQGSDSIYSVASNLLVAYLYGYHNRAGAPRFFASANLICAREAFERIGGFDETFRIAAAEDRDFCDRWVEHGLPLLWAGCAIVHHAPRLSFRRFIRQHFNYGRGARHLHLARSRRGLKRPRLEPLSFYVGLLGSPLRATTGRNRFALITLMIVTQFAYVAGYLSERLVGSSTRPARPGSDAEPKREGVASST